MLHEVFAALKALLSDRPELAIFAALIVGSAIFVSLVPTVASLYIGHFLLHIEPIILCGAIAGQQASTPAIKATEAAAGNSVPVVGYTVTYAIANVALPFLGPLFVTAFAAIAGHPSAP